MSIVHIAFIVLTVIALSLGQILFRIAALGMAAPDSSLLEKILSGKLLLALTVYAVATIMWLFVLRSVPLRLAYPFVALAFILVPVLAHYTLGEPIGWNTFIGGAVIAAGVCISVYR